MRLLMYNLALSWELLILIWLVQVIIYPGFHRIPETFEPEQYWDWRVGGVAATGHRVDPRGPEQCRLTFTVPVWAAGYTVVCRVALNRIKRLLALSSQEDRS